MDTEQRNQLFHIHNMDRHLERLVDELNHYDKEDNMYVFTKNDIDNLIIELTEITKEYEYLYNESVNLYLKHFD